MYAWKECMHFDVLAHKSRAVQGNMEWCTTHVETNLRCPRMAIGGSRFTTHKIVALLLLWQEKRVALLRASIGTTKTLQWL